MALSVIGVLWGLYWLAIKRPSFGRRGFSLLGIPSSDDRKSNAGMACLSVMFVVSCIFEILA
jgi:hypothetical protein